MLNGRNLTGSVAVQCPIAKYGSMKPLKRIFAKPLGAAIAGALVISAPMGAAMTSVPAYAQSDKAKIDRVVRALRGISTMKADFTQTDRNGRSVTGDLTLKMPGKIRFEYEKGVNLLVVSSGGALNMVDYDVRQVERWPINDSPLGALLDPNRDVAKYGRLMKTANASVTSIAVKYPERPEFGEITLIFRDKAGAPGGLELVSWVMLDAQNERTTVRLRNHRYGMSVPNSTFTFRDPRPSAASRRPG